MIRFNRARDVELACSESPSKQVSGHNQTEKREIFS